jgi:hypothetical protein
MITIILKPGAVKSTKDTMANCDFMKYPTLPTESSRPEENNINFNVVFSVGMKTFLFLNVHSYIVMIK